VVHDTSGNGNDGTIYGLTGNTLSNSTVLQLTSSASTQSHTIKFPYYNQITSASLTVYYRNWTSVASGSNKINVSVNGNYIGTITDNGETSAVSITFNNIQGYLLVNQTNVITYSGGTVTNITQTVITYSHTPTWVKGKFGYAYVFDGINDYVLVPDSASLQITNAITVEAWVNTAGQSVNHDQWIAVKKSKSWTTGGYGLFWGWFNDLYFSIGQSTSGQYVEYTVPDPWNKWLHIAGLYDGTNLKLYVNGELKASATATVSLTTTADPLRISRPSTYQYKGIIDEVCIYNRALSAKEEADLYSNYGYSTPNYPGHTLVKKYTDPEPTTSVGKEQVLAPPTVKAYPASYVYQAGGKYNVSADACNVTTVKFYLNDFQDYDYKEPINSSCSRYTKTYSNLSAGSYTIGVYGYNAAGSVVDPAYLTISSPPPSYAPPPSPAPTPSVPAPSANQTKQVEVVNPPPSNAIYLPTTGIFWFFGTPISPRYLLIALVILLCLLLIILPRKRKRRVPWLVKK